MTDTNSEVDFEQEIRTRLRGSLADTGEFFFVDDRDKGRLRSFQSVIEQLDGEATLDPVALCEFPGHYSFYGNRTLLKGVRRTDTSMGSYLDIERTEGPRGLYATKQLTTEAVSDEFTRLLIEETKLRVKGCRHVGILLSGGMDSRIAAAALRELQNIGWDFKVTCFTWGKRETRDPTYAKRIAGAWSWSFEHFEIDADSLKENVKVSARLGCFCSAMHLHAMPAVARRAKELGVEIMIAGSYGDSIGRAEYSRVHVSKLTNIQARLRNWYGLIDHSLFKQGINESRVEIERTWKAFGLASDVARPEVERQVHYMRNMLGSAMSVIDEAVPLAQAFTSWPMVEFIWSLEPSCRKDEVYLHVLRNLAPSLLAVPWARTGKLYLQDKGDPIDDLKSSFHEYGEWTRSNLAEIKERVFSGRLGEIGILDFKQIELIFLAINRLDFIRSGRLLELALWFAALSIFLDRIDISVVAASRRNSPRAFIGRLELCGSIAGQYRAFKLK